MEEIWQNWAKSPPLLGFAGGSQVSRVSKPGRDQHVQMQANRKVHLNWKTVLMGFNLFTFYTAPQTPSNSLSLLFWKFTACIFSESEILKKVNCLCTFGWSSTDALASSSQEKVVWSLLLVPWPPLLSLRTPEVPHSCHCCDNGWSHYRICHFFT